MGLNADIKRYDPRSHGQPLDLFSVRPGRLPVVLELLRSPWVVRGSDIASDTEGAGPRLVDEEVCVVWARERGCPVSFRWRHRLYPVDAVAQTWAVEKRWWLPSGRVSRRCFRVLARGGVYDLAYDRLSGKWLLLDLAD